MNPAGGKLLEKSGSNNGVAGLFTLNHQKMDNKRDPLSTYDINGGVKKN